MPQLTLLNQFFQPFFRIDVVYPALSDRVYIYGYDAEDAHDPAFLQLL